MTETNAVSIKLPTFWIAQPQVWFQQAEAQFTIRGITVDDTKYAYLVAALDQDTASCLLDILSHPPREHKYDVTKDRLLKTFGLSRRVRATKLLNVDDLGERNAFCSINRMSDPIRLQLADVDFTDPRKVAEQADRLWLSMEHNGGSTLHNAAYPRRQAKAKPTAPMKLADTNPDRCYYWRASEASETLSGVTQSRFRYIYLFIYLFIYMVRRTSFFARASNYVLVKRF